MSTCAYAGYGRNKMEALHSLDSLIRYHHDNANVRVENDIYYVWDGTSRHTIFLDVSRGRIRAFINV